eukprot:560901-Rhodomonas_salina.3
MTIPSGYRTSFSGTQHSIPSPSPSPVPLTIFASPPSKFMPVGHPTMKFCPALRILGTVHRKVLGSDGANAGNAAVRWIYGTDTAEAERMW